MWRPSADSARPLRPLEQAAAAPGEPLIGGDASGSGPNADGTAAKRLTCSRQAAKIRSLCEAKSRNPGVIEHRRVLGVGAEAWSAIRSGAVVLTPQPLEPRGTLSRSERRGCGSAEAHVQAEARSSSLDRSGSVNQFRKTNLSEGYPSGQRGQTVNLLAYAFGGSNPPPSTSFMQRSRKLRQRPPRCGSSSMVEPQPSKLMVRVRFPSPAPLNEFRTRQQLCSHSSVGRALPW